MATGAIVAVEDTRIRCGDCLFPRFKGLPSAAVRLQAAGSPKVNVLPVEVTTSSAGKWR